MIFYNDFKFPEMFNVNTGEVDMITDIKGINQSLSLLFQSEQGELFGDPDFGSYLHSLLLQQDSIQLKDELIEAILEAVATYEPRIIVTKDMIDINLVTSSPKVVAKYNITLNYNLRNTSLGSTFTTTISADLIDID